MNLKDPEKVFYQWNFYMKVSVTILALWSGLLTLTFANDVKAQAELEKKISLHLKRTSLAEAFAKLEDATRIPVLMVGTPSAAKVSIDIDNKTLGDALKKLLTPVGLTYKLMNHTIVVASAPPVPKNGKISGKVMDEKNGPLPGANIKVLETGKTLASSADGSYAVELPTGTYTLEVSYLSYQTKQISGIVIGIDKTTPLDIVMQPAANQLSTVVIKSDYRRSSIESLYARQKNSAVPTDGISADQIARTPDKNIGEVLRRISGVSTVDNKYVVVRGLSERYNQSTLNGQTLPSTELNRKQFSFDMIPANMVDEVTVSKSVTPDMSAEFGGGIVQVVTKEIPNEDFTSFTIGSTVNDHTTNKAFMNFSIDSRNYLAEASTNRYYLGQKNWNSLKDITDAGFAPSPTTVYFPAKDPKQFINNWGLIHYTAPPSQNYQASVGRVVKLKDDKRLGFVGSLSYRNTWQSSEILSGRGGFDSGPEFGVANSGVFSGEIGNNYQFATNIGALAGVGLTAPHYKFSVQTLLLRTLDQQASLGFGGLAAGGTGFGLMDNTLQTSLWQNQFKGEYVLGKRGIKLQSNFGYIKLDRQRPDNHLLQSDVINNDLNNGNPTITTPSSPLFGSPLRFWNRAYEEDLNWGLDISIPFKFDIGRVPVTNTFKTGYAGWRKHRLLWVANTTSTNTIAATTSEYAAPLSDYFDTNTLHVTSAKFGDDYNNSGVLNAGYMMMDNRIGPLRMVYGLRMEYYDINKLNTNLQAYTRLGYTDISDITRLDPNIHWFPSANLTYNFIKSMDLRLAYARSIVRPDLRELAQFSIYDFELGGEYAGQSVRSTVIDNLEARYEWFPGPGDIFSISAFYKKLDHPMEIFDDQNVLRLYTLQNSISAKNRGIETELRKSLSFTGWPIVKNITLYGNFTYITGTVVPQKLGSIGTKPDPQDPHKLLVNEEAGPEQNRLQAGASNYTYNAGGYYTGKYFTASLIYNNVTNRLFRPSFVYVKSLYERPLESLDGQVTVRLPKQHVELKCSISNLLNSSYVVYQNNYATDGKSIQEYPNPGENNINYSAPTTQQLLYQKGQDSLNYFSRPGRTYSFSLTYNF